jgi:hypothetical protein
MLWTRRLEDVFPEGQYVFPNWRSYLEISSGPLLEPGAEVAVKLTAVPKTAKAPRLIAIEPTCMQYMQQGLLHAIESEVGRDNILTPLIGWHDQRPNQSFAMLGSLSGNYATLDLKEASDRVSAQLIRMMISSHRPLLEAVDACRSRKVDVPGFGIRRISKFASMGSALTFPFESMVFMAIIVSAVAQALSTRPTEKLVKQLIGQVRVYGDDIIIPVEFVHHVITELETFGFRVNGNKSFWTGRFRESCGKEFYGGHDVSIVKCRRRLPTSRADAEELVSAVSFRNQLKLIGYDRTVEYLDKEISLLIPFPKVLETSPLLGKVDGDGLYEVSRWDRDLQRPLVKGVVVHTKDRDSRLDGWFALHKFFTLAMRKEELGIPFSPPNDITHDLQVVDVNHLLKSGRPVSVDIKTRWASPL